MQSLGCSPRGSLMDDLGTHVCLQTEKRGCFLARREESRDSLGVLFVSCVLMPTRPRAYFSRTVVFLTCMSNSISIHKTIIFSLEKGYIFLLKFLEKGYIFSLKFLKKSIIVAPMNRHVNPHITEVTPGMFSWRLIYQIHDQSFYIPRHIRFIHPVLECDTRHQS